MKILLGLLFALVLPTISYAESLAVKTSPANYKVVMITASKVQGVNIRLSQVITRDDCNRRMIRFSLAYVDGNKEGGWYQTNFASAGTLMTEIGCPLTTPVTETVYSNPVFVKSLTNPNLDGEILLTLIVPSAYEVEVTEVK